MLTPSKTSAFLFWPRGTGKSTWLKAQGPSGVSYALLDAQNSLRLAMEPGLGVCRALSERAAYAVLPEEKGILLETLLLNELRAYLSYHRLHYPLSFWRTPDDLEVDVLFETKRGFVAVEIKSSPRWEDRYGRGLARIREEWGTRVKCLGVFLGDRDLKSIHGDVLTVPHFLSRLWDGDLFE